MSGINNGGAAFPSAYSSDGNNGMTLRDYFAAKAMQELLSQDGYEVFKLVASDAYKLADAMIKAREAT